MKSILFLLAIPLIILMVSCNSPTQEINESPIVTIWGSAAKVMLGDTLRIILHAEDSTLKSGTINFDDSNILSFNNLKSVFDTTINHVFTETGSYNIVASFTDGSNSTSKEHMTTVSDNPPPIVTLTANKKIIAIGDTLKVSIHATDNKLTSGSLDFGDGTIHVFPDKNTIDTTVIHIYSKRGTFSVSARFSDGYSITVASISVDTKYYYALSFSIGTIWKYSYYYFDFYGPSPTPPVEQTGVHQWKILSLNVIDRDTIYNVEHTRDDKRVIKGYDYGKYIDTTIIIKDTLQITILYSHDLVKFSIPLYNKMATHNIANHSLINDYPVYIPNVFIGDKNGGAFYDMNGLNNYYYSLTGSHGLYSTEKLILTEFMKPSSQ